MQQQDMHIVQIYNACDSFLSCGEWPWLIKVALTYLEATSTCLLKELGAQTKDQIVNRDYNTLF
jgi:hypothetical protein